MIWQEREWAVWISHAGVSTERNISHVVLLEFDLNFWHSGGIKRRSLATRTTDKLQNDKGPRLDSPLIMCRRFGVIRCRFIGYYRCECEEVLGFDKNRFFFELGYFSSLSYCYHFVVASLEARKHAARAR